MPILREGGYHRVLALKGVRTSGVQLPKDGEVPGMGDCQGVETPGCGYQEMVVPGMLVLEEEYQGAPEMRCSKPWAQAEKDTRGCRHQKMWVQEDEGTR